jgi:phosphoglycerate dehydrogenase-like enzyme
MLATPHVGWHTELMFSRSAEAFAANLQRFARGEELLWTVNAPSFRRTPAR